MLCQVGWLRGFLGPPGDAARQALRYAGVLDPTAAGTEWALRSRCLLLIAVCLKRRSMRRAPSLLERARASGDQNTRKALSWKQSERREYVAAVPASVNACQEKTIGA